MPIRCNIIASVQSISMNSMKYDWYTVFTRQMPAFVVTEKSQSDSPCVFHPASTLCCAVCSARACPLQRVPQVLPHDRRSVGRGRLFIASSHRPCPRGCGRSLLSVGRRIGEPVFISHGSLYVHNRRAVFLRAQLRANNTEWNDVRRCLRSRAGWTRGIRQ
jgi:hypothetical protein